MRSGKCSDCDALLEQNAPPSVIKKGNGYCHSCHNSRIKRWKKRNPLQTILFGARSSAKRRNLKFELTESDLPSVPEFCPVFPWIRLAFGGGRKANTASIDRIKNDLGYVKGNVRIISLRANVLRGNANKEELVALLKDAEHVS